MKPHGALLIIFFTSFNTALQARELPNWEELTFRQSAFWLTAQSHIRLLPAAAETGETGKQWQLLARSEVASNQEQLSARFSADSGRILQRDRLSRGKNQRLKQFRYGATEVLRERRSPAADNSDPADWPLTSTRNIAYPEGIGDTAITGSYPLLVMAETALNTNAAVEYIVHTDFNFYRVALRQQAESTLVLSSAVPWETGNLSGERAVLPIEIEVTPLPGNPDKADFSLLGLIADIQILYDKQTRLPLQLRGRAPRLGPTQIDLVDAKPRDPQAGTTSD